MNNWELYRYAHKGGGSGTTDTRFKSLVGRTITDFSDDSITTVGDYVFYEYRNLTTVNLPNAINIGNYTFFECSGISNVYIPNATTIGNAAFSRCSNMTSVFFPNVTYVGSSAFYMCEKLTTIDFPNVIQIMGSAFNNCTNLAVIVVRTPTVALLNNATAFTNTPIASGTGYIYVPDELVDSYKTATNWTVYAEQIKPLSEYGGD